MKSETEFDYIIVGAGSAGCVLAHRLTEDPTVSVLLLEAGGPDKRQEIHIPAAFAKLFKGPCDWAYYTQEQPELNHRKLYWPRGKMLGGSSSMNAMIYTRGNPHDYDHWRELGNEGWSFAEVRPYFERAEHSEIAAATQRINSGLLNVAALRSINPLTQAFVLACGENNLPRNDNFNGAEQIGAGCFHVTQKRGQRHSAAAAYLKPALKRSNLIVQTFAQTTRCRLSGARAAGVEYLKDGQLQEARASREVILCGGAINSPQLLMLSGIGPAAHLESLGLPVVTDLPGVGQNLQDHLLVALTYECTKPVSLAGAERLGQLANYLLFKKGMLTSNVGEAGGFLKTKAELPAPDLELIFGPTYYMSHGFANPRGHGFSVGPILLHPQSTGNLQLRSADPLASPVIQPNYLAVETDRHLLVEGAKLARRLAAAKAFEPYRGAEVWPGASVQSDEELTDFIRRTAESLYHPVGTCKMGQDGQAVVDAQLRVHGIDGLRVVDASIMPTIPSGHTNAPTIMIAEKAADLIKRTG